MQLRITLKQLKMWSHMTLKAQLAVFKHKHPPFVLNHHILKVMQLLSECLLISGLDLMIIARLWGTIWMTKLNPPSLAILQWIHHLRHPHLLVFLPIDHHLAILQINHRLIFMRYQHVTTYLLIYMTLTPALEK